MQFENETFPKPPSLSPHKSSELSSGLYPEYQQLAAKLKSQTKEIEQMAATITELENSLTEERLKAQKQLNQAEMRFSAFMTYTPALVWINDRFGNLVFNNKVPGIQNPDQPDEHNVAKLFPEDVASLYQHNNQIVIETNQPIQVIEPILLEDGTFGQALVYKFPLPHPDLSGEIAVGGVGIDITDQYRIQEQLLQSEERYRLVVDNLKEVVFQADASGNFLLLNPAWTELTGFKVEESIGHYFLDFVYPEDRAPNLELFLPLIERKKDYCRHEVRYLTASGDFRWFEVFARPTIGKQQEVLGISGTFYDITERREAERVLRQRAHEFEALVENAPDIISRMDRELRHLYVNKAIEAVTIMPKSRFIGKTHTELGMPKAQVILWRNALKKVFNSGRELQLEYEFPTSQGIRYFHSRLVPERGEAGRIETVLNIARDITERKRAEELVKIRTKQQKVVADLSNMALQDLELDTFFLKVTERVASTLNTPYTQVVERLSGSQEFRLKAGTGWDERQFGKFRQEVGPTSISNYTLQTGKPVIADYLGDEQPFTLPRPFQNKGITGGLCVPIINQKHRESFGVLSAYTLESRAFTQDDINFLEAIANLIAISLEHKKTQEESLKLERQFLQSQKMESLGVLSGGIAHDFNNLLGVILGNTEMAQLMMEEIHPASKYLEKTVNAIQRAADLVQQLLAYAGKAKFQATPFNLNNLIIEMTELLRLPLTNKTDLRFELEPALPEVMVDPTQMRQIIMNLLRNATEALGSKAGTITLKTGLLEASRELLDTAFLGSERREGSYIYLQLSDTGIGMDATTKARIFEPFFSTKFTGRGLGLSAVLGIIRAHQGALKVDSQPGQGTTFTILLPLGVPSKSPAVSGEEVQVEPRLGRVLETGQEISLPARKSRIGRTSSDLVLEKTILIIEDEKVLRETTSRFLRQLNYKTLLAPDGRSGLEMYHQNKEIIDCVMLDLVMPQMGGEEIVPELFELNPRLKLIIMSGYSENGVSTLQKEGFGFSFLQKPFTIEALDTLLKQLF